VDAFRLNELEFHRMMRLPRMCFAIVDQLKMEARRRGEDIIDLGMGNPDLPTPKHIVNKLIDAVKNPGTIDIPLRKGSINSVRPSQIGTEGVSMWISIQIWKAW